MKPAPGHNIDNANASDQTYIISHCITLLIPIVVGDIGTDTFSAFLEF